MNIQAEILAFRKGQSAVIFILKMNGFVERVSHILVKSVIILMLLLNIFKVGFQHIENDFRVSVKQQGVFSHKEISALFA